MPELLPLHVLVSAAPDAPGADALLDRARRRLEAGGRVGLLLTGSGLAWLDDVRLERLAAGGARVALCSRSAREHGVDPAAIPPWVRWSSLLAFLGATEGASALWGLLP